MKKSDKVHELMQRYIANYEQLSNLEGVLDGDTNPNIAEAIKQKTRRLDVISNSMRKLEPSTYMKNKYPILKNILER